MENIGEKRMDMISKWEEKSRDFIDAFLLLFGREGRLVGNIYGAIILYSIYSIIIINVFNINNILMHYKKINCSFYSELFIRSFSI